VTPGGGLPVSLLYLDGCPNWQVTDERLREALDRVGHPDMPIEYLMVTTPDQVEELRFRGSPTVLIHGRDPFLDREAPMGLSCRIYDTEDGLAGSPTVEQLVDALHTATATGSRITGEPAAKLRAAECPGGAAADRSPAGCASRAG
jgi:hypothetical protein